MRRLITTLPAAENDMIAEDSGASSRKQYRARRRHVVAVVALILALLALKFVLVYLTFFTATIIPVPLVLGYGAVMWVSIAGLVRHGWRVLRNQHTP